VTLSTGAELFHVRPSYFAGNRTIIRTCVARPRNQAQARYDFSICTSPMPSDFGVAIGHLF